MSAIAISQLFATLNEVAHQLKSTSGDDPFISQTDLDKLLLPIYQTDLERAYLLSALYAIADITEPTSNGRITRNDIDRAVQIVLEKIIPAYRLLPGELSQAATLELSSLGVEYVNLAQALKVYTTKSNNTSAQTLVFQLRALTQNLRFNTFQQANAGISVDFALFNAVKLTGATFLQALETSGNPDWEGVTFRFGTELENSGTSIEDFWAEFTTLQADEASRERALMVERLWRAHLSQSRFIRYDNQSVETTHFVVAGLTGNQEVVFMLLQYIWT